MSNLNIKKIKTYVGFAIRSKAIIYGVDSILETKPSVIIYSENLAEGSKNKLLESLKKNGCYIFQITKEEIEEIFQSENIKAFAIMNKDLAKAIIDNI